MAQKLLWLESADHTKKLEARAVFAVVQQPQTQAGIHKSNRVIQTILPLVPVPPFRSGGLRNAQIGIELQSRDIEQSDLRIRDLARGAGDCAIIRVIGPEFPAYRLQGQMTRQGAAVGDGLVARGLKINQLLFIVEVTKVARVGHRDLHQRRALSGRIVTTEARTVIEAQRAVTVTHTGQGDNCLTEAQAQGGGLSRHPELLRIVSQCRRHRLHLGVGVDLIIDAAAAIPLVSESLDVVFFGLIQRAEVLPLQVLIGAADVVVAEARVAVEAQEFRILIKGARGDADAGLIAGLRAVVARHGVGARAGAHRPAPIDRPPEREARGLRDLGRRGIHQTGRTVEGTIEVVVAGLGVDAKVVVRKIIMIDVEDQIVLMATGARLVDVFDIAAKQLALPLGTVIELDAHHVVGVVAASVRLPGTGAITRLHAVTFLGDIRLPQIEIGGLEFLAGQLDQRIVHRDIVDPAVGGLIDQSKRRPALGQHIEREIAGRDIGIGAGAVGAVIELGIVLSQGEAGLEGGEPRLPQIGTQMEVTEQLIAGGAGPVGVERAKAVSHAAGHVDGQRPCGTKGQEQSRRQHEAAGNAKPDRSTDLSHCYYRAPLCKVTPQLAAAKQEYLIHAYRDNNPFTYRTRVLSAATFLHAPSPIAARIVICYDR